jgi:two-component system sensor histidine kinase UhpB
MNERANDSGRYPDYRAWSDMLAGIAEKNAKLGEAVAKRYRPRSGASLISELERERARIARELHAGAGQPLAGIKLHLERLDECAARLPDSARVTLDHLRTLADQALGQVRAVSHRLHPPAWQEMSMRDAIESLLDASGFDSDGAGGTSCRLTRNLQTFSEEPAHDVKVQIYRCAQECISNIIRHSGATEASVILAGAEGRVMLTVTDNGKGFDTSARTGGLGLRAIAETAAAGGGNSVIESGPEGTKIVIDVPLNGE